VDPLRVMVISPFSSRLIDIIETIQFVTSRFWLVNSTELNLLDNSLGDA
jgi:hypothetical protein